MNPLRLIAERGLLVPGIPSRTGVGRMSAPRLVAECPHALYAKKAALLEPPFTNVLFTKTQLRDQCVIAFHVCLLEIGEEAAALVDHGQ